MSGGLWLKMVENLLLTVGALPTELAMETCSSLSNGLKMEEVEELVSDKLVLITGYG